MKLCKDCNNFQDDIYCVTGEISLVTGKNIREYCVVRRMEQSECKPEGLMFVQKITEVKPVNWCRRLFLGKRQ